MTSGRILLGLVVALSVWSLPGWAEGVRYTALDYSKMEHCVGPTGSSPVFKQWVGEVDTTANSVVKVSADPVRLEVNLASGWKRAGHDDREVVIKQLRRSTSMAGLIIPEPVATADRVTLTMSTDVDAADPLSPAHTIDSYLFEFRPTASPNDRQFCVLTFGDVWAWSGDTLTYTSPLQPKETGFTPGEISAQPLKERLYGGQSGLPQQLWLEPLSADAPAPRYKIGRDSTWTSTFWDGSRGGFPVTSNAIDYNLWLCSPGPSPADREICVVAVSYQLSDAPLVIRTKTEASLTQQVALRQLAQSGVLLTSALVAGPASTVTRDFRYNGQRAAVETAPLHAFAPTERDFEYTVALYGSADIEHNSGRCPDELQQPRNRIAVFAGAEGSAEDVVACLYERESTAPRWTLLVKPQDNTPDQDLLGSLRFSLCSQGKCVDPMQTGAGRLGFRLKDHVDALGLQVANNDGATLALDQPTTLETVSVAYPPKLPDAPIAESSMTRLSFKTFARSEWEANQAATCIASQTAWKDLGVTNETDGAATLMLWAGDSRLPIGDGRWKLTSIFGKELLCPELTDQQVDQLLATVRSALLRGGSASLYMIQGGRLVGHSVVVDGPSRPTITGFQLLIPEGAHDVPLQRIARRDALPAAHSLCALSGTDWGDQVFLDPSKIQLRDNQGTELITFESKSPRPQWHPFVRTGRPLLATDPWTYCSKVGDEHSPGGWDTLIMHRTAPPAVDVSQASWRYEEAGGCGANCGDPLPAQPLRSAVGLQAMAAYHTGLAWGHVFSWSPAPPTEARVYLAVPLLLGEYAPFEGKITLSGEAGGMIGLSFGRNVVNEVFTSRIALPISGYVGGCLSATAWRKTLHASPQLCAGAALDLITPKTTATAVHPGAQFDVEGFGLTPFVSIGLGQF